jgi:LacI family transcriptional regulator
MRAVAREAGVSVSTVSNVLNSPDLVATATRRRVEKAMRTVGYVRNSAARRLRGALPTAAGAVLLDIANPFYGEVARGAEDRLAEAGCLLLACSTDADPGAEARYLGMLEEQGVRGILLSPVGGLHRAPDLASRGTPVVYLEHPPLSADACAVRGDDHEGGRLAAAHLIALGHRRIGFLSGSRPARSVSERRRGAVAALRAAGLDPEAVLLHAAAPSSGGADAARTAVEELLALPHPPTAIMCMNDLAALGALHALDNRGIDVPGGMSLIGYDDIAFAQALRPPLTTIRQPAYRLGRTAAELLLEESSPEHRHREVVFPAELVVRGTTGPPQTP